jgi:hypothetical protein
MDDARTNRVAYAASEKTMSNQFARILGGVLFVIAGAAAGVQACGSDSSSGGPSGNAMATCNQVCDKVGSCLGDASGIAAQAVAQCKMSCGSGSGQTCTNQDAILAKVNECLAIADCVGFLQCASAIPPCQGGTTTSSSVTTSGAGGSTGTTTTGGTGGGSGANCDACTKADSCCVALGGMPDQCQYSTTCNGASGSSRDQIVGACNGLLQAAASSPNAPAACK